MLHKNALFSSRNMIFFLYLEEKKTIIDKFLSNIFQRLQRKAANGTNSVEIRITQQKCPEFRTLDYGHMSIIGLIKEEEKNI